jgi:hypothetical protein
VSLATPIRRNLTELEPWAEKFSGEPGGVYGSS